MIDMTDKAEPNDDRNKSLHGGTTMCYSDPRVRAQRFSYLSLLLVTLTGVLAAGSIVPGQRMGPPPALDQTGGASSPDPPHQEPVPSPDTNPPPLQKNPHPPPKPTRPP